MGKGIVITGPTGAIGMALIKKCIAEKTDVLALCHRGSLRNGQIPQSPYVRVLETELNELDKIDLFGDKAYNIFYHLAWSGTYGKGRNNMQQQLLNIQNTLKAVDLAARLGCEIFVGAGSQAEYGRVEGLLGPDTPVFPENGYGVAKLCAGQMSRIACGQNGLKHIWVRILSVYGPYDRSETMVSSCLRKMLKKETAQFTKGEQIWDFLYSGDAAEALYRLGEHGKDGSIYCLGSGTGKPLKEYILTMQKETGGQAKAEFGAVPYNPDQVMYLCADIDALKTDTGFLPVTDFKAGIRKTIEWIKEHEENQYSNTLL